MATSFLVTGLVPGYDPSWRDASAAAKLAYLKVCRELVLISYDQQLAAGVDFNGIPFTPIKASTRLNRKSATGHPDPLAPPLTPAHHLSRIRRLVDARVEGFGIRVFWRVDMMTGRSFGVVVEGHATGYGNLPVRNALGLSPLAMKTVKVKAHSWWTQFTHGMVMRSPKRGTPNRVPIKEVPKYVPKTPLGHQIKAPGKVSSLEVGGNIYTMGTESMKELKEAISMGRFRGFH